MGERSIDAGPSESVAMLFVVSSLLRTKDKVQRYTD